MKKASLMLAAALVATLPVIASAQSQFSRAEDAVKYRQSALFIIGQHFGRVGAMVTDKAPFNAEAAKVSAQIVASMAGLPWEGFVPGSEKAGNTKAQPAVWSQPDKFKAASERLIGQAPKFAAAAQTGDKAQLKTAFEETFAACRNCHQDFRAR